VNQDLVDDDLEEQRRDQREQLEEERRHQHLAEHVAVLVQGAEKPGDVEAARQVQDALARRHQHKLTVPHGLELLARHQARLWRLGRLDNCLVVPDLADDDETAITQHRDAGHRRRGEAPPARSVGPRLEPQFLGAAQHLGHADRPVSDAMADLLGIGPDALKPQHGHKDGKAGIGDRRIVVGRVRHPAPERLML
jgi:hypothetical protein